MSKHPRTALLKVIDFSKDGFGRGTWSAVDGGKHIIEVPFSMPGDEVCVELHKKRKGMHLGKPIEWRHLSSQRVSPRCKHFGSCGGCRWQHVDIQEQLKQKESWIHRFLDPLCHSHTEWHSIVPCDPPWHYRNKMELTFSNDKVGNRYLGLILQGTRGHVFQMEECHLAQGWMVDAVKAVSKWWEESGLLAYYQGGDRGSLRTLVLREGQSTGDRMVMLTVSGNPQYAINKKQLDGFVSALRAMIEPSSDDQKLSVFIRIQQIAKGHPTQFYEMLLYGADHLRENLQIETSPGEKHLLHFRVSPSAFFQPNTRQAERLYSRAVQLTNAPSGGIVYDLYCGTGTLGICMAKKAKKVIGIELSPESSLDARENVKHNQLSHVTIRTGDVGQILPELLKDQSLKPDVVMVDPPRCGLDARALQHLIDMGAPKLTYISCNPATQAVNIETLVRHGYRIQAVQPVDQFPQTIHVENVVVLTRD